MSDIVVRGMKAEDYDSVAGLWEKRFKDLRLESREGISRMIEKNPGLCLVAEEQGKLVGALLASFDGRQAMLHRLAVDKEYEGRGIGRSLFQEVEKRLKEAGAPKVFFYCREELLGYFRKMGYKRWPGFILLSKNLEGEDGD